MTDIYTALLNGYIHDMQWRLKKTQEDTLDQLTKLIPMSDDQKFDLSEQLTAFRARCFMESFSLGMQLGLRIGWEFPEN